MNYCYSNNNEAFREDLCDVVQEYIEMMDPPEVKVGTVLKLWRGEIENLTLQMLVPWPHDLIGEHLNEQHWEHTGLDGVDWPGWTKEQAAKFDADFWRWLEGWLKDNDSLPTHWSVKNVKPFEVRLTAVRNAEIGDVDYEDLGE